MYKERTSASELTKQHKLVSAIMYDTKSKEYLGEVKINCNEAISGNRILVSKDATYFADSGTFYSSTQNALPLSATCEMIASIIPKFQAELSQQDNQRTYSNDYKLHFMRLVNELISSSKEKAKDKSNSLTRVEKYASMLKVNQFKNLDFITVKFRNCIIKPRETEEINCR